MNKLSTLFILICITLISSIAIAQTSDTVRWSSKDQRDTITIENGNNMSLAVSITVDKPTPESPGIVVTNCGRTTALSAGSTALCYNNNGSSPISFSSDSTNIATGSYQVTQR